MRIAFFTDMFLPQMNGVANAVVQLAKGLSDRGNHVYIIAPRFPRLQEFTYPNITVKRCASIPAFVYPNLKLTTVFDHAVLKFIKDNKVEIIHFHTPATLGLQAILTARLLKLPLIGTFHGFFMDQQYLKHLKLNYRIVESLVWRFSNLFYNRCDAVVCHSESVKSELLRRGCRRPVKVIPLGIDFGMFSNKKAKTVKQAYNRKGKLLLYAGRIAYEKNILYLLECVALALKQVPDAKLLIVGDGPQMPQVKAKIRELCIQDKVILTGMIEHAKLVKSGIFGACDIFVNASTTETGPLTMLEAQANGLVCVSVKGKGMALVKDGVNGFLVEATDKQGFAQKVVKLLSDSRTLRKMKSETLKTVKGYDIAKVSKEWEKTYQEQTACFSDKAGKAGAKDLKA